MENAWHSQDLNPLSEHRKEKRSPQGGLFTAETSEGLKRAISGLNSRPCMHVADALQYQRLKKNEQKTQTTFNLKMSKRLKQPLPR